MLPARNDNYACRAQSLHKDTVRCSFATQERAQEAPAGVLAALRTVLHGGKSTGPRTDEGRQRIAKAHLKHGRRSKSYLQQSQDLKVELRAIETDLVKTGLLKKDWGQLFNY